MSYDAPPLNGQAQETRKTLGSFVSMFSAFGTESG